MIPRVSKAFFIPADPPSPFLSLFVITNSGKSQKSQSRRAVAPVVGRGGVWSRVTVQGEQGEGRGALLLVWGWGRWWVWSSCGAVLMVLGLAPGGTWHLSWVRQDLPLLRDQDLWEELIPLLWPGFGHAPAPPWSTSLPMASAPPLGPPVPRGLLSHQPGPGASRGLLTPARTQRGKNNPPWASVETIEGGEAPEQPPLGGHGDVRVATASQGHQAHCRTHLFQPKCSDFGKNLHVSCSSSIA